jgi:hypothetical protein
LASPDSGDGLALTFAEDVVKHQPPPSTPAYSGSGGWMGA